MSSEVEEQQNKHAPNRNTDKRALKSTFPSIKSDNKIGGEFTPSSDSVFLKERLELWNILWKKQQEEQAKINSFPITITIEDNTKFPGISFKTTPIEIAKQIGPTKGLLVAKVSYIDKTIGSELAHFSLSEDDLSNSNFDENWIIWDLNRPFEGNCKLNFLNFEDKDGKTVFWHSSAHILGESLERLYGSHLTVGPPLTNGFYYDSFMGDMNLNEDDYKKVENEMKKIIKENQKFERLVCTKEELLQLFKNNPFKKELILTKIKDGSKSTCYRCGTLIDLCRGPHLTSTGQVGAMAITKHSSAYWLGNVNLDSLQRVYAISFPDKIKLKEYFHFIEEAKARDHRHLGNTLNLFFFEPQYSPGSAFWLPLGAKLYLKLCNFMREEYRIRGFQEVISPNLYNSDLWKISGHYQNYKDNMFSFDVEKKEWGLKPMNCPGHCLIFKHISPSYKQLPIKLADFGVLHRNELSGSLSGLTRVRRFQQDDAHIFCTQKQVLNEVQEALNFLFFVYNKFNFTYQLILSTRPNQSIGSIEQWNYAEEQLKEALNRSKMQWKENPGDGAFYGPKIDILLFDALNRSHQCGTIQLDFQLPKRFDLQYQNHEAGIIDSNSEKKLDDEEGPRHGMDRPVMIHRAILGSLERMCAVLIEHTGGKFPFWLSPRQAIILPINGRNNEYGYWIMNNLKNYGFDVEIDDTNNTINKKIRSAQLQQWNYILVVGDKEQTNSTATVRDRAYPDKQECKDIQEIIEDFEKLNKPYSQTLKKFVPWNKTE